MRVTDRDLEYRDSDDYCEHKAEEKDCYIYEPSATELLLDLDSEEDKEFARKQIILATELKLLDAQRVMWLKSSTEGHHHAIVTLRSPMVPSLRLYWEALLGGDRKRALLALAGLLGDRQYVSILFRPNKEAHSERDVL